MFYHTEAKPQCWRAVAIFDDGRYDQLLYLNRSSTQIRAGYRTAFFEVLDEEERSHVKTIALQRWNGAPDSGRWMHQTNLTVPVPAQTEQLALSA
jgi:hypothetical protein